jgi:fimbrial chaperone protein
MVGAVLLWAASSHCADFEVKPTQVSVSVQAPSAMLTMINNGSKSVSFQLSSFSWSENALGTIALAATEDLIFFPQLFTLAPGEQRKIRVGVTMAAVESEMSYRLLVEELPAIEAKDHPAVTGVTVLTHVSIPVFVQPLQAKKEASIVNLMVNDGKLSFQVKNAGNEHFTIESVMLSGLSADGQPVFKQTIKGWYLLAGDTRPYVIPLSANDCGRATQIEVSVHTEDYLLDKVLVQRLPISAAACMEEGRRVQTFSPPGANSITSK